MGKPGGKLMDSIRQSRKVEEKSETLDPWLGFQKAGRGDVMGGKGQRGH